MIDKPATLSRRRFLAAAAKAGAVMAAPALIPGTALGKNGAVAPSQRITLAGIGIHNRGMVDLGCMMNEPVMQFVGVADVRKDCRDHVRQVTEAKYGRGVAAYRDFRELLPRRDIDAVLIATGDRWHALAAIYAARAGKDIYCEKPCSMTIAESQSLAETIRRYGRIYQAGTQRRSVGNFIFARELARAGKLGKLTAVHASTTDPNTRPGWLPAEPEPPKEVVDWDLWLGPCPWRPYNSQYLDGRGWSGAEGLCAPMLDWGAHSVDQCNWTATDDRQMPVLYEPTVRGCVATYADGLKLVMRDDGWLGLGSCPIRYEGEDGWVETGDSGRIEFSSGRLRAQQ